MIWYVLGGMAVLAIVALFLLAVPREPEGQVLSNKAKVRVRGIAGLRAKGWKGLFGYDPMDIRSIGLDGVARKASNALIWVKLLNKLATSDPDPQVRQEAETAFVELFTAALADNAIMSGTRCEIVKGLKEVPGTAINTALLKALEAQAPYFSEGYITWELIDALGDRREKRAIPLLQQTIKASATNFGEKARMAIKKIEDK